MNKFSRAEGAHPSPDALNADVKKSIHNGKTTIGEKGKIVDRMREADLTEPLELKKSHETTPAVEGISYIRQISEGSGLQTCYPTSILNGWVHQGALSREEAYAIQERFRSDLHNLFGLRQDIGSLTFNSNPYEFAEIIKESSGKNTELHNMRVGDLDIDSIAKIILQELNRDNVLVAGNAVHAVFVGGYEKGGSTLATRDPLAPNTITPKPLMQFATDLKHSGDAWITIIPKQKTENQTAKSESKDSAKKAVIEPAQPKEKVTPANTKKESTPGNKERDNFDGARKDTISGLLKNIDIAINYADKDLAKSEWLKVNFMNLLIEADQAKDQKNLDRVNRMVKDFKEQNDWNKVHAEKSNKRADKTKPENKEEPKPSVVTTAKGSSYVYLPDGRTQRYKKATNEMHEPQDILVFIPPWKAIRAKAPKLYPTIFKGIENQVQYEQVLLEYVQLDGKTIRVIDKDGKEIRNNYEATQAKNIYVAFIDKTNQKNNFTIPVSLDPKIGYNTLDTRSYIGKNGKTWRERHMGNAVTNIHYAN